MIDVKGKRVAVVGMAKSGIAAVDLLRRHGAEVRAIDQKPGQGVLPQTEENLSGLDLVVLSPGVPIDAPELRSATHVIGEVELAGWFLRGPIIGITGANGKTTTTALIGHILRECGIPVQVGGNIGTPPTAMIDSSRDDQWNVLELSSFQLETIETFKAKVAVATNVTPDHLDRHHTFEVYAAAKARLFEMQDSDGAAVLNADDPVCVSYAAKTPATALWFSSTHAVEPGIHLHEGRLIWDREPWIKTDEIPLPGLHNVENTMAAALAARVAGAKTSQIAAAVRSFPGVEHRLEFVRERNGVRYYNDSKATNVDATMKAVDAFAGGLWIILGGKDKGSDYTVLREPLRKKARRVLLIGAAANKIEDHLQGAVPVSHCGTLDKAVPYAAQAASPGEIVLLAPACASFDQFQSYEHRGRVFKELVQNL
jgi:UDP-N-acetylmuramoylalanine--D-glutamate ligase